MRKVRVQVVCEVNEDDELRANLCELLRQAGHGGITLDLVCDAVMQGSIIQEMKTGRADVHVEPIRK